MSSVSAAEATVPVNQANRLAHIDALRAGAVMLVVAMHAGLTFLPGDGGVTAFFAISGFIITHILLRERETTGRFSIGRFYWRRAWKIAPPFLVITLLPTLLYATSHEISWSGVLAQIFFTYNWQLIVDPPSAEAVLPGSEVLWSLAVEEQFYIVFAVVWLFAVRARHWRRTVTGLAAAAVVYSVAVRCILALDGGDTVHVLRGTDARMEAIAWGILAAVAFQSWQEGRLRWLGGLGRSFVPVVAVAAFFAGSAIRTPWAEPALRPTVHALAATAIILYGLLAADGAGRRWFHRLVELRVVQVIGLASYSIYLVHHVLDHGLESAVDGLPSAVRAAVLIVAGAATGVAAYFLVERPALAARRALESRRARERVAA